MRLDNKWLSFKMLVIPPFASANQIKAMKRAFYAGAASAYEAMACDIPELEEDAAVDEMKAFADELLQYAERLKKGLE